MEKSYPCDLCDHPPFKAPTALGRHKLSAHNIPGQSTAAKAYRIAKAKEKENAKFRPHARRPKETTRSNVGKAAIQKTIRHHHHIEEDNRVPDGALAVAFGRFQELCRSFAYEYDLPPKLFTTRLTQFISASAVR